MAFAASWLLALNLLVGGFLLGAHAAPADSAFGVLCADAGTKAPDVPAGDEHAAMQACCGSGALAPAIDLTPPATGLSPPAAQFLGIPQAARASAPDAETRLPQNPRAPPLPV